MPERKRFFSIDPFPKFNHPPPPGQLGPYQNRLDADELSGNDSSIKLGIQIFIDWPSAEGTGNKHRGE